MFLSQPFHWFACAMAALEPRRLGAAAGVGAATKASEAAFSRAKPPGSQAIYVVASDQRVVVTFVSVSTNKPYQ
jgi:hypothetical protein